jgi:hypothetical protein
MSAATSTSTGRSYGVERVCRVWEVPRLSFYAQQVEVKPTARSGRRGPKPRVSDQELLKLIREDLAASPWERAIGGSGHGSGSWVASGYRASGS